MTTNCMLITGMELVGQFADGWEALFSTFIGCEGLDTTKAQKVEPISTGPDPDTWNEFFAEGAYPDDEHHE